MHLWCHKSVLLSTESGRYTAKLVCVCLGGVFMIFRSIVYCRSTRQIVCWSCTNTMTPCEHTHVSGATWKTTLWKCANAPAPPHPTIYNISDDIFSIEYAADICSLRFEHAERAPRWFITACECKTIRNWFYQCKYSVRVCVWVEISGAAMSEWQYWIMWKNNTCDRARAKWNYPVHRLFNRIRECVPWHARRGARAHARGMIYEVAKSAVFHRCFCVAVAGWQCAQLFALCLVQRSAARGRFLSRPVSVFAICRVSSVSQGTWISLHCTAVI